MFTDPLIRSTYSVLVRFIDVNPPCVEFSNRGRLKECMCANQGCTEYQDEISSAARHQIQFRIAKEAKAERRFVLAIYRPANAMLQSVTINDNLCPR